MRTKRKKRLPDFYHEIAAPPPFASLCNGRFLYAIKNLSRSGTGVEKPYYLYCGNMVYLCYGFQIINGKKSDIMTLSATRKTPINLMISNNFFFFILDDLTAG